MNLQLPQVEVVIEIPRGSFLKRGWDGSVDFISPFPCPFNPNVANAGGLQSQGVKGEVVLFYFESLTTQNLKSSGVPEG